jgi:quercetin dioxygenase-like cupin family protein
MSKAIAGAIFLLTVGAAQADDRKVVVTPVAKTTSTITGQPIVLPQANPEVTVSVYEVPPGGAVLQSLDAGLRYDYVLSGHLRITNPQTGAVSDFSQGDFVVGRPGQWASAKNAGDTVMKLVVIRQAPVDNTGRRWLRAANGFFLKPVAN